MSEPARLFFHLGMQKTGSTFLQHAVFPNLQGILYCRKGKFKKRKAIIEANLDQLILFTNEQDIDLLNGIQVVSSDYPDAGVILIFRRQDSWIRSKYTYHIRKHGCMDFEEFFDLESDRGFWKKDHFYYQPKIRWIEEHFNRQPLILIYDDLKTDAEGYVKQMTDYLGSSVSLSPSANIHRIYKPAFSPKVLSILKRFNRFYRYKKATTSSRFLNKVHYKYREFLLHIVAFFARFIPASWVPKEIHVPPEKLEEIRAYYQEDWEKTVAYNRAHQP